MIFKQQEHSDEFGSEENILRWLIVFSIALLLWPLVLINEFAYERSWVSAHFAIMARSFVNSGIIELGLLPVQNSGPLTSEPDYYYHWPPFFPVFLSWILDITGRADVFVVHAVSTILVGCQAALIGFWVKRTLSAFASLIAVLTFLNLPIVAKFAHAGLHLHLAFVLALLSILIFDHAARHGAKRPWVLATGALSYGLACFTSWEPILILPGMAIYWLLNRSWRTGIPTLSYCAAGFAAMVTTLSLYLLKDPDVIARLLNRALYRAGFTDYTNTTAAAIHDIGSTAPANLDFTFALFLEDSLSNLSGIGIAGLAILALAVLGLRQRRMPWPQRGPILVLFPLMTMAGLWIVLMPQHFSIHDYQAISFAIPAALSMGFLARFAQVALLSAPERSAARSKWPPRLAIIFGVALIGARLNVDIEKFINFNPDADHTVFLGKALAQQVPENGIVAVPWKNMVQTFYSNRHVVRGIESFDMFELNRDRIARLCGTCPLYLVLDVDTRTVTQEGYENIWQRDRWRLLRVPTRDQARITQ